MTAIPPLPDLDREIAARTAQLAAVTDTLVELDRHPGLAQVRRYPPTGETARRWASVQEALSALWTDLGHLRDILDIVRATRGSGHRLDEAGRVTLARLLWGRTHEIERTPIPLAERRLTGPRERIVAVGVADTLDRMRAAFPVVAAFADAVESVNGRVIDGAAPLQRRVEASGGALAAVAGPLAELLRRSGTDPLGFAPGEVERALADLAALADAETDRHADQLAIVADWPAALAALGSAVSRLAESEARAAGLVAEAAAKILCGAFPDPGEPAAALRAVAADLRAPTRGDPAPADALLALRTRVAAAQARAEERGDLAQGLLDRRAELRGRLQAYRAKAARLGVSEERDVLAADRIAAGLLTRRPCDLGAVTRAVADYRQIVGERKGAAS
ncbi:hypothetical protein [Nocardia thailandica]